MQGVAAVRCRFCVMLCGHSYRGQIIAPRLTSFFLNQTFVFPGLDEVSRDVERWSRLIFFLTFCSMCHLHLYKVNQAVIVYV